MLTETSCIFFFFFFFFTETTQAPNLSTSSISLGLDREVLEILSGYAPPIVAERCLAGQGAGMHLNPSLQRLRRAPSLLIPFLASSKGWLAEMRRVSVIFVGISSLRFDSPAVIGQAQTAMSITQTVLAKYEGTLRQFIVDGQSR
jgi:hypothetical protein